MTVLTMASERGWPASPSRQRSLVRRVLRAAAIAIVGRNAFAHEAGIHQDGILKDRRTYEIMQAEDVGVPWQPLVLGKHSGRHAVQKRLSDLGLSVDAERMVAVYRALMDIADERKIISDEDLLTVVKTVNEAAIVQAWRAGLTACSTPVARSVSPRDPAAPARGSLRVFPRARPYRAPVSGGRTSSSPLQ